MSWILDETVNNIIRYIANKKEFTEKEVKKQLKIKENEIRKVLYKLEEYGIVYPIDVITLKDGKYDFRWGVKVKELEEIYNIIIKKEIENIDNEMKEMPQIVYYCEECDIEYDEETAEMNDYKCKECGSILIEKENKKLIDLKETKEKLLNLLEEVKTQKIKAFSK